MNEESDGLLESRRHEVALHACVAASHASEGAGLGPADAAAAVVTAYKVALEALKDAAAE